MKYEWEVRPFGQQNVTEGVASTLEEAQQAADAQAGRFQSKFIYLIDDDNKGCALWRKLWKDTEWEQL